MNKLKTLVKKPFIILGNLLNQQNHIELAKLITKIQTTNDILIDNYIQERLFNNPKYSNPKKLNKYEYQVFSQNGEDGIIQEIFNRVGTTNKFFVEFGTQDGIECNTTFLLFNDWNGCWLDGSNENVTSMNKRFDFLISRKRLSAKQAFVTAENIEKLFESMSVPKEFDLLSIDIDGNDYWVWKAIKNYSPRVVIIEFNSIFRPPVEFIVKYDPDKFYPITSHFGASLKSLEILGAEKGYKLVGCDFLGVNAFFVRKDLVNDKFLEPFTAETHFETAKYFLTRKNGHRREIAPFVSPSANQ